MWSDKINMSNQAKSNNGIRDPSNAKTGMERYWSDIIEACHQCLVVTTSFVLPFQVFFPIPFAEYNPQLVYKTKQKPTFVEVHRNNGFWDRLDSTTACFNNKDYKDIRMLKDDFLDENQSTKRTLLDVFNESKLQVFRAVDAELRKRYSATICFKNENVTFYHACTQNTGQRLGSRAQLAQLLFQSERFASWSLNSHSEMFACVSKTFT